MTQNAAQSDSTAPEALLTESSLLSISDYCDIFEEFGSEPRFRVLYYLSEAGEDNASSIADALDMDAGTLRYHLKDLVDVGLVENHHADSRDEHGNYSFYRLTTRGERFMDLITDLVEADQSEATASEVEADDHSVDEESPFASLVEDDVGDDDEREAAQVPGSPEGDDETSREWRKQMTHPLSAYGSNRIRQTAKIVVDSEGNDISAAARQLPTEEGTKRVVVYTSPNLTEEDWESIEESIQDDFDESVEVIRSSRGIMASRATQPRQQLKDSIETIVQTTQGGEIVDEQHPGHAPKQG